MITRENTDPLVDPSRIYVLMKRPGEPATFKIRLPGDIFGVDAA